MRGPRKRRRVFNPALIDALIEIARGTILVIAMLAAFAMVKIVFKLLVSAILK